MNYFYNSIGPKPDEFFSFHRKLSTKCIQLIHLRKQISITLFTAFNEAFIDYEIQITSDELRALLKRRGFVPELSFGAFENERLIAFTFNGIGVFNDIKTAYDTGTGTIKEFRGRGIATEIFNNSIPFLKDAGVSQYLLEVLQHNPKAVSVYRKLGFEVSREFYYFTQVNPEIKIPEECNIRRFYIQGY